MTICANSRRCCWPSSCVRPRRLRRDSGEADNGEEVLSADELKTFAAQIAAHPQTVGALFSSQNGVTSYALCRSVDAACDLRALCQSLNKGP